MMSNPISSRSPRSHARRAAAAVRAPRLMLAMLFTAVALAAMASGASAHRHVPTHIATWAFDDGCSGGAGAPAGLVRRWVSYAENNCGVGARKALTDCHSGARVFCRVMQYMDTDWVFRGDRVLNIDSPFASSWWLTSPGSGSRARIYTSTLGGGYLANQNLPQVQDFFRRFVRRHYNADDGLLMDWQSPSLSQQLYYSTCACRTTRQIRTDRALRAGHAAMSRALTHRDGSVYVQADNTLPGNPYLPQGLNALNHRIGVDAWTVEGEPMSDGLLTGSYSTLLDQMGYIVTRTRGFVAPMSRAPVNAPYLAQTRRVQEATVLLAFRPGHVVDWADLEQGSDRLSVWPEEGIYPTRPRESMRQPRGRGCLAGTGVVCARGGHRSLEVARGIYRREFRFCYRNGIAIGACAVIMNTTRNHVTVHRGWLRGHYRHAMTFVGGDVGARGSVNPVGARFTAGVTQLAPHDALLLAR